MSVFFDAKEQEQKGQVLSMPFWHQMGPESTESYAKKLSSASLDTLLHEAHWLNRYLTHHHRVPTQLLKFTTILCDQLISRLE